MEGYYYDRTVCTGLGDRVGALMTLLTLSRMYDTKIYFRWCEDSSEVFETQRHAGGNPRAMPHWFGYDYNLTEFYERFWGGLDISHGVVLLSAEEVKSLPLHSLQRVKYLDNSIPPMEGLDQLYTTAHQTTMLFPSDKQSNFARYYREAARLVYLHTLLSNYHIVVRKPSKYVVLHMRGYDLNAYTPYDGCHDNLELYCTKKVLRAVIKKLPKRNLPILVISNNLTWAEDLVGGSQLSFVYNTSEYDDFALLLGASGIIQHSHQGWSSYSNNPAMMAQIPLITTYKPDRFNYRYSLFEEYGKLPNEFHECGEINVFIEKLLRKISF